MSVARSDPSDDVAPTVTVVVPALNEGRSIRAVLESIVRQTYPAIIEILVVDGGSSDDTVRIAQEFDRVRVVGNPEMLQAAALNVAIREATGEYIARVDGHTIIADDYVERCVEALKRTGAAMVGGAMTPVGTSWVQRGIAAALRSRLGAGPAVFHVGGSPQWVDTVYLGAYPRELASSVGGYRVIRTNEDAEFAIRMGERGGVYFDPQIRSEYSPRSSLRQLGKQFFRYGQGRAATVVMHPRSLRLRQTAAPLLLAGVVSPMRRPVLAAYLGVVALSGAKVAKADSPAGLAYCFALPVMHFSWAAGFYAGVLSESLQRVQASSLLSRDAKRQM